MFAGVRKECKLCLHVNKVYIIRGMWTVVMIGTDSARG